LFPFVSDPRDRASSKAVAGEFRATGFEPEGFTLFSYAVMQALAEGVRRAGDVEGAGVAQALRNNRPTDTVLGPLTFDAKGDVEGMTYEMFVWHDGHYSKLQ
jgi:branched-chain amino acid transport system substrate-binding protein